MLFELVGTVVVTVVVTGLSLLFQRRKKVHW